MSAITINTIEVTDEVLVGLLAHTSPMIRMEVRAELDRREESALRRARREATDLGMTPAEAGAYIEQEVQAREALALNAERGDEG
jgi:hypothetical protein